MRKSIFTTIFILVISLSLNATIRTVSNSTAFPGQYATVDAAIAASSIGDTIYVMPSASGYGTATLDKQLIIIGSGLNPQRPSHLGTSMSTINITPAASGSSIMGIYFGGQCSWSDGSYYLNNMYISECGFGSSLYLYSHNTILENCFFNGTIYTGFNVNVIYQNNVFNESLLLNSGSNSIIRNNIFASHDANRYAFGGGGSGTYVGAACQILNNIFYKNNPAGGTGHMGGSTYKNNIYHLTNDPTPTNATSSGNLNANPLFVDFPAGGSVFGWQFNYHLQSASPGINYGTDGRDLGMWGGMVPINAGFEPPIPRIYDLTALSSSVPVGGTLQLTIKATKAQ